MYTRIAITMKHSDQYYTLYEYKKNGVHLPEEMSF